MNDSDVLERLKQVIAADGRSFRSISDAAGLGPNYVQQFMKDGKSPGAIRLAALLKALDQSQSFFVLTGIKASEEDLEFLRMLTNTSPEVRTQALQLLKTIQGDGSHAKQPSSAPEKAPPKE